MKKKYRAVEASMVVPMMREVLKREGTSAELLSLSDRGLLISFLVCERCNGWLVDPRDIMEHVVPNSFGQLMALAFAESLNKKTPWIKRRKHVCVNPPLAYPTWHDLILWHIHGASLACREADLLIRQQNPGNTTDS